QTAALLLRRRLVGGLRSGRGAHGASRTAPDLTRPFILVRLGGDGWRAADWRRRAARRSGGGGGGGGGARPRGGGGGRERGRGRRRGPGPAREALRPRQSASWPRVRPFAWRLLPGDGVLPRPCGGLPRLRAQPSRRLRDWRGAWPLPRPAVAPPARAVVR